MKKIFCLFISAVLLLSGCKNSDTSNATSSKRKSEGQSPVLLKITDYDENAKLVSWTEYDYSATHQVKWQKYASNHQSEGYGIEEYTDDGVLISDCSYNADGEPVNEYAYAETGTLLKDGSYYYAEDGTLSVRSFSRMKSRSSSPGLVIVQPYLGWWSICRPWDSAQALKRAL